MDTDSFLSRFFFFSRFFFLCEFVAASRDVGMARCICCEMSVKDEVLCLIRITTLSLVTYTQYASVA